MGCMPYFHTWCDLRANLGCRSETCCTRLAGNAWRRKSPKSRHLRTIVQICRAIQVSSQQKHVSTIGKTLLSSNISRTCPDNMVNFGPLAAEMDPVVWDTQQISTGFASWKRYCTAVKYWASAKLCGVEQRQGGHHVRFFASCISSEPRAACFRPAF